MSDEQTFLYDDFFASADDAGRSITISLNGRDVPLRVKARLTVKDKEEAQAKAVSRVIDPKTGKVSIGTVDDAQLAGELLSRFILEWPFKYQNGTPVPITPESCQALSAKAEEQLLVYLNGAEEARQEEQAAFPASDVAEPAPSPVAE